MAFLLTIRVHNPTKRLMTLIRISLKLRFIQVQYITDLLSG